MLISTTDADWIDDSQATPGHVAQTDGGDILFTASDGTSKLDHEIETYDPVTGELVAWVKVSTLSGSTDTSLYIYYGNTSLTEGENQWNAAGVWDVVNNWRSVWHLHETSGSHLDSTSNGYTGTVNGTVNQDGTGKIDGADDFVGPSESWLSLADGTLSANSPFTIQAWIYLDSLQNQWIGLVTKGRDAGDGGDEDWVGLWVDDSNQLTFGWDYRYGANLHGSTLSAGQWYYAVATYDGSNMRLYLNGSLDEGCLLYTSPSPRD